MTHNDRTATGRLRRRVVPILAILMLAANIAPFPAPVAAASPTLSDFSDPFHFLEPLGREAGDPARFDGSLLDDLVITICRVEAAACTPIKTLTSASSLSERLRVGPTTGAPSYYLANWDVSKLKLPPFTYRIIVEVAGLVLGSTDVGQAQYKSFGRTWPIKFRVEKNPTIRVRILRSLDQSASQVANVIRIEFGLSGDDVALLLARDIDPYSAEEIDLAIRGVFQPAVIPATTKIADPATQAALTTFDATTGRMTFATMTSTISALAVDDVLVGEPNEAAPNGYLRTVTSITKPKKGGPVVVETRQATINEAIKEGTLDAAGALEPEDILTTEALPGVSLRETQRSTAMVGALDIGDGYSFHETFDVTINGAASEGGVSGTGTVRIQGEVKFNAGYNVGFGVEECLALPPVCVDRFEAHLGVDAYSDVRVTGNFTGHMHKEYVLSTKYFKPIVFFIGPVPVVLVPIVKAIAGVDGNAHLEFSFEAQVTSRLQLGAKWTDPGDGGQGWEDLTNDMTPTGVGKGDLRADMELRAYAKTDAKLLLYGIAGPGLAGRIGVGAKVQYPGNPLWTVFGHARGEINFAVDLGGILKLSEHVAPLPEFKFELAHAANQAPVCGTRMDPIPAAVDTETYLGPQEPPLNRGYFSCSDPEGEVVDYSATFNGVDLDYTKARWSQPGTYDVVITASDQSGKSRVFTVKVAVNNTPPILEVATATGTVPVSVQYFVTAAAWDVETEGYLPCASLAWTATGGTVTTTGDTRTCTALVVFDQVGSQTVRVVATDKHGKSSEQTVTVNVTTAPVNPAPEIDPSSFAIFAETGPHNPCFAGDLGCDFRYTCPSGAFCRVPYGAILYNGAVGSFHAPLTLRVSAADPNGDTVTVTWRCKAGSTTYPVVANGDGTSSCSPYSASITTPIEIWAEVSDGVTTVRSGVHRLYMLDRVG